jgi:hypothetical protein
MSFKQRALNIRFALVDELDKNKNITFSDGKSNQIELTGHRAEVVVTNPGGTMAYGLMHMRVFGMTLSDMNALSTDGMQSLYVRGDQVFVSAGDIDGIVRQIFAGTIMSAYIDFSAQPEVSFNIQASAGFYHKIKPAAPNSWESIDVATAIEGIAASINFGFSNPKGVSKILHNQYLSGTAINQIQTLASAADIPCAIENNIVSLWPNDSNRDDIVVDIGPNSGLVGYPSFEPYGISVKTEFNPELIIGRQVNIGSLVSKASGAWNVHKSTHELSTLMPGGPWFTALGLARTGYYVK